MSTKTTQHDVVVHEFLKDKPIYGLVTEGADDKNTQALILGTIYPSKKTEEFKCNFFYGNDYSIWGILEIAFPKLCIYSLEEVKEAYKKDVTMRQKSADKVKAMLKKYDIAISDTVLKTKRKSDNSSDNFSKDTVYNEDLVEAIKNSNIETIYCTSVKTYRLFSSKICKEKGIGGLPKSKSGDEITVSNFGRDIKIIVLPSPSSSGARGNISYREAKKQNEALDYTTWCIPIYKEKFHDCFCDTKVNK